MQDWKKKYSSPTFTFYTLGNDTCLFISLDQQARVAKADAKTVEVEKNIHFKIWYTWILLPSSISRGQGYWIKSKWEKIKTKQRENKAG